MSDDAPKETFDERVGVQTAAHRGRTSVLFGLFVGTLFFGLFWITETPKRWRWLALALAIVLGGGLYFATRPPH